MERSGGPSGDADGSHDRESSREEGTGEDEKSPWEEGDFKLCIVDVFYRDALVVSTGGYKSLNCFYIER